MAGCVVAVLNASILGVPPPKGLCFHIRVAASSCISRGNGTTRSERCGTLRDAHATLRGAPGTLRKAPVRSLTPRTARGSRTHRNIAETSPRGQCFALLLADRRPPPSPGQGRVETHGQNSPHEAALRRCLERNGNVATRDNGGSNSFLEWFGRNASGSKWVQRGSNSFLEWFARNPHGSNGSNFF